MEQVDIRLASADDKAVSQIRREILSYIPGATFDRVYLGRSGDWLCSGAVIDDLQPSGKALHSVHAWLQAYSQVRLMIAELGNLSDTGLKHLDELIDDCKAEIDRPHRRRT